nr:hypothetical protein [Limnohabitans sp. Rim8]
MTSPKRSKELPDLPAMAESGLPVYPFDSGLASLALQAFPPIKPTASTRQSASRSNRQCSMSQTKA